MITFEDMLPFGKLSKGVLAIEKSFSVSHTPKTGSDTNAIA